jgi:hypothetical protein
VRGYRFTHLVAKQKNSLPPFELEYSPIGKFLLIFAITQNDSNIKNITNIENGYFQ